MDKKTFIDSLKSLGIIVTDEQMKKLDWFYKLLIEWNEKINLTTIIDEEEVYLKHFYDSLTLIKVVDLTDDVSLCDVGSGAGFPGVVLKICFPNLKVTLIDSLNKRVIYLNDIINKLGLDNIEAIHTRIEEYSRSNTERFDIITARAVTSIPILSEICSKALKLEGQLILMKGNCEEELIGSKNCFLKLNLELNNFIEFKLPIEGSNRTLVVIKKKGITNKLYPRHMDKIKKNPL